MPRPASCPTCQKKGSWLEGPFAPFCSERCKLIDLGKWLGEEYRIASPLTAEDLEELSDTEVSDEHKEGGRHFL